MIAKTSHKVSANNRKATLPVMRRSVRTRSTFWDSFIPHRRLPVFPAGNAARRKCFVGYARLGGSRNPRNQTVSFRNYAETGRTYFRLIEKRGATPDQECRS